MNEGWPISSQASRLLGGTTSAHLKVEKYIEEWMGVKGVLSFSSGYQANVGLIPALI